MFVFNSDNFQGNVELGKFQKNLIFMELLLKNKKQFIFKETSG